jgi:DNA-binding IclR family transcriptional regulator
MDRPLTDCQREILDYINARKFRAPTVREIAKHVELSPSTVQGHVEALRKKGALPEQKRR